MRELEYNGKTLEYSVFDPTGNITALVETAVDPAEQPDAAAEIMKKEPDVEQVGFVSLEAAAGDVPVSLRMAGGEFCGNASMCAAALYAARAGLQGKATVKVQVSGASAPVEVKLEATGAGSFDASVSMPPARSIGEQYMALTADWLTVSGEIPIVRMEGIDHVIIEKSCSYNALRNLPELAEDAARILQVRLGSDCVGMMFISEGENGLELKPLVYVPGADTIFWENSCASGTSAAGMWFAKKEGRPVDMTFREPAGRLRVESDPSGATILHGSLKML